jgi:hypothetical protein
VIAILAFLACVAVGFTMVGWCWHAFWTCVQEERLWHL